MPRPPNRAVGIATALVTALGFTIAGPAFAGTGRVSLLIKTNVDLTPEVVDAIAQQSVSVSYVWPEIRAMAIVTSSGKVSELQAHPLVQLVEPDVEGSAIGSPPTEGTNPETVLVPMGTTAITTWNQDMANTSGSAETGSGVTVVVLDSGLPQNWEEFLPENSVDLTHAAGFGAEGWGDFHNEQVAVRGVGGHIGLFPHGLAVSSVIAGFPSEFGLIGGSAPGARLLPIRVLNQFNSGWFSWFTAAMLYIADLKASGAVPGPLVVNFSIQAQGSSLVFTDALNYAISQGVLFVTIAGNFHPFATVSFPGRLPQSITAAATGWVREGQAPQPWFFGDVPEGDGSEAYIAPFSGREPGTVPAGSLIDVAAPGSFVFGEWLYGPGFSEGRQVAFDAVDNFIFGTSFAAPHVAGIVARMLEKNPGLTQAEAEVALRSTALAIPDSPAPFATALSFVPPWDGRATGAGLAQGAEAVAATPLPVVNVAPASPARRGSFEAASIRVITRPGTGSYELRLRGFPEGPRNVSLYDVQGRLVRDWTLTGSDGVVWDGRQADGARAPSGVYFVRGRASGTISNTRMVLTR